MTTTPPCSHYWVIQTANGPESWGKCKYCKVTKQFQNWVDAPQSMGDRFTVDRVAASPPGGERNPDAYGEE